jgi:hypothetical protein
MVVLRADPWAPEYGMGYEARAEDSAARADVTVETSDWSEPRSALLAEPQPVVFVDGVRRVEVRLLADQDAVRAPALFGSFAVGSVDCDGRAAFGEHLVARTLVLGGGLVSDRVELRQGGALLSFEPSTEPSLDPNAPLARLQDLMRDAENALAARLAGGGSALVLLDGPLRLGEPIAAPVVGIVKRFVRRYLEPAEDGLLGRLAPGQRTPVFALLDQQDARRGFSWYTRLRELRRPWHDHAGLVRCEVRASLGLDVAVSLADRVSALLPSFAGRASDPRAPQNLAPVGGLETWLRHRMGDARLIRRALLEYLSSKGD